MTNDTLLLRQVNPTWVQEGRVTSQVFRPTPKDEKLLSVYDGDKISAEDAWKHHVENYPSVGVMGVTVGECKTNRVTAKSDPAPFPEHAVIDYTGHAENQIRRISKELKATAEQRNWLYQANDN
ncbi:MAG: hypothetical protein OEZ32_01020 [Nitrospinota bacterium]|nr:hypothetical protein [Nitrospinota bacterium]